MRIKYGWQTLISRVDSLNTEHCMKCTFSIYYNFEYFYLCYDKGMPTRPCAMREVSPKHHY